MRVIPSTSVPVLWKGRVPPPLCPSTLKMKQAWKQALIKSLYLKLLVTVKHWRRERETVSDWWSVLQASNCVHVQFILADFSPLLPFLTSTFLLFPPHQLHSFQLLSPSCPRLFLVLIPLPWLLLLFYCSFKANTVKLTLPSLKSPSVALWGMTQKYIIRHFEPHPLLSSVLWPPTHSY